MAKAHSHDHSYEPKPTRKHFYFTFVWTGLCLPIAYFICLSDAKTDAEKYPKYYFEFWIAIYLYVYLSTMLNLVQAGLREPGKSHKNFLKQADVCKRCNTERFERSHHCSMCSQCTLRMDHHCQWTDNCVGLKNHKNFLLYVLFTVLGGSLHVYFALCYILGEIPDVMPNMLLKLFFYFHTLIIIIFTYFCCTLLNLQLRLIYNNVTTIEYYKEIGMNFSFIKCVVFNIESIYDLGSINNFLQIFGDNVMSWVFPIQASNFKYQIAFPSPPSVTADDILAHGEFLFED